MRTFGTVDRSVRLLSFALFLCLLTALTPSSRAGELYTVIDLSSDVGTSSQATAINRSGQVAGFVFSYGDQAFRWDRANVFTFLPALSSGAFSRAYGINDAGQVVGYSYVSDSDWHACLWQADGTPLDLGTLGGSISEATDINNAGQVVGRAYTQSGSAHAFLWDGGTMRDLGSPSEVQTTMAVAINDAGQVAGNIHGTSTGGWGVQPCLWEANGDMVALGLPPGATEAHATGINDAGQVVGYYYFVDFNAGLFEIRPFLWEPGNYTDLTPLPGTGMGRAFGINNNGLIAGESSGDSIAYACFWDRDRSPVDLGALLGSSFCSATAINDAGQVVGTYSGWYGDAAFLVVPANNPPVAEPDVRVTDEDTPLVVEASQGLLANDFDLDGDVLSATLVKHPAHGQLTLSPDGAFIYSPASNYNGADSFSYFASDGRQSSAVVTVSLTVTPVNDPPVLSVANGALAVTEGDAAAMSGAWSDVDGDWISLSASAGKAAPEADGSWQWSFATADGPGESQAITITAEDENGGVSSVTFDLTVLNAAPSAAITGPISGIVAAVNTPVSFRGSLTDAGALDTHTGVWTFTQSGVTVASLPAGVSEANGKGILTLEHGFDAPGVYAVSLAVQDKDGASASADTVGGLPAYVVVYDPSEGFVTGGGWLNSPAGAVVANPTATGKASFGFVARYKKGAVTPDGHTEFQLKAAGLNFRGTALEWLVVSGSRAQVKGSGIINGGGDYGFLLTVEDGQVSGGVDRIRLKIWENATGTVVYDNQNGNADNADLTTGTGLGGGSIVLHTR